jgi:hypothetical protein
MKKLICVAFIAAVSAFGCGSSTSTPGTDQDVVGFDTIDNPTIMRTAPLDEKGIAKLELGVARKNSLSVKSGWHLYTYKAATTEFVAFKLNSSVQKQFWTYLKIVDDKGNKLQWVTVAKTSTNLAEIIVPVKAGRTYTVLATSQQNSDRNDQGLPNNSTGGYTLSVVSLPIGISAAAEVPPT